jgi:hypothetical protein
MWTTWVPRNVVDTDVDLNPDIFAAANLDDSQLFKERMRDNYMIVDLEFDNANQSKFNVAMINVNYRSSIR